MTYRPYRPYRPRHRSSKAAHGRPSASRSPLSTCDTLFAALALIILPLTAALAVGGLLARPFG